MNKVPKAVVLTSDAPRHRYFSGVMAQSFNLIKVINQPKKEYYTSQLERSPLIQKHFRRNRKIEALEFSNPPASPPPTIVDDINSRTAIELAGDADVVLLFGTSILGPIWLDSFSDQIVNLHLGLSPFYKGSATLFWPFAEENLAGVGATIHLATSKVDSGAILKLVGAKPRAGDSYYTLTNRLIREAIDEIPATVKAYLSGNLIPIPQETSQRNIYRKSDFNEQALVKALSFVGNGLTEELIESSRRNKKCPF